MGLISKSFPMADGMMEYRRISPALRCSKKVFVCSLIILFFFMVQTGSATVFLQDGREVNGSHLTDAMNSSRNVSSTPFPIQFFYNTHCGSCQEAIRYFEEFSVKNPDIKIESHDLFNNTTSFALYEEYKKQFNRSDLHYPVIFIGNVGIMGSDDIKTDTQSLVTLYQSRMKHDPLTGLLSWISSITKGS